MFNVESIIVVIWINIYICIAKKTEGIISKAWMPVILSVTKKWLHVHYYHDYKIVMEFRKYFTIFIERIFIWNGCADISWSYLQMNRELCVHFLNYWCVQFNTCNSSLTLARLNVHDCVCMIVGRRVAYSLAICTCRSNQSSKMSVLLWTGFIFM